jgi:hypothetical protein
MSKQKVGLQWRKRIVAIQKCTTTIDYVASAYSRFWEVVIETSKIHNLFIQYPNNTYFIALESS